MLSAAAQATERIPLMTYVTCPTTRYHPAVVAQKAATVQLLSQGRFRLGLGSGENVNEHVVGGGWPAAHVRLERLEEAVEIIRALLAKRILTHQEHCEPIDVPLPWLDPEEPGLAREDRRRATVRLLVYTGQRNAITRTTWNTTAWKPALAGAGVISPLPKRQPGEKPSRVGEPSREQGFPVLRHTYASVMLEPGEPIVSLAKWLGQQGTDVVDRIRNRRDLGTRGGRPPKFDQGWWSRPATNASDPAMAGVRRSALRCWMRA